MVKNWLRRHASPTKKASPRFGRKSAGRRQLRPPLRLEHLEDRTVPSTVDLGPIRFDAPTFTQNGNDYSATGQIALGLVPTGSEDFTPLLQISGSVAFTTGVPDPTFTSMGDLSAQVGGQPAIELFSGTKTFDANELVNQGLSLLDGQSITVADVTFTLDHIQLVNPGGGSTVDSEVALQGSLTIPELAGLEIAVDGSNFVEIDENGVRLTGVDASITGSFTVHGLTITANSLTVSYSSTNNEFELFGGLSASATDISFDGTFGDSTTTPPTPGLVVLNGTLQSLDITISDNLTLPDLTASTNDAHFTYQPGLGQTPAQFQIVSGTFSVSIGSTLAFSGTFGSDSTPGLVIEGGTLQSLDITLDSNLTLPGLSASISDANLIYQANPSRYKIDSGNFSVSASTLSFSGTFGSGDTPGLVIQNGGLYSLDVTINGGIAAASLSLQADGLQFVYNAEPVPQYEVSGMVSVSTPDNLLQFSGTLGSDGNPGLVFNAGQLQSLDITVSGGVTASELQIQADGLEFQYYPDAAPPQFAITGGVTLTVGTTSITANLGGDGGPGLVVSGGTLTHIDMSVSGTFDLFGLTIQADDLTIEYDAGQQQYAFSGGISVPALFNASVSLGTPPQNGLIVKDGEFYQISDFTLSFGDVPLGAFTIEQLVVSYSQDDSGNTTIGAGLMLAFPAGWAVGGSMTFVDGEIDSFSVTLQGGDDAIPIGDTGLFVSYLSASVQNIDQPDQLIVSGTIGVNFGEPVSIPGSSDQVSIFAVVGTFTVDKNELTVDANVAFGAVVTFDDNGNPSVNGVLGGGGGTLVADWQTQTYSLSVNMMLYGGVFDLIGSFTFNSAGDITIEAQAAVVVPDEVPFIGGDTLASMNFLFEFRPNTQDLGIVAAWVELDIIHKFDIGFEYVIGNGTNELNILGTRDVQQLQASESNPQPSVFTYTSQPIAVGGMTAGATGVTLSVDWANVGGTQTVAVILPDGDTINQSDFSSANGISLVPQLAKNGTSLQRMAVHVVGSSTDPEVALPAGSYQLVLISTDAQLSDLPTFTGGFSFTKPTVSVGPVPFNPSTPTIAVPVTGTAESTFVSTTRISLFVTTDNQQHDGVLIGSAQSVQFQPGGQTLAWDLNGLLPVSYYTYALIDDGHNPPVFSPTAAGPVSPTPPLIGTVADSLDGRLGLAGLTVFLDLDENGQYNPATDAATLTLPSGFYAFYNANHNGIDQPLNPGQAYQVGVVIPNGFELNSQFTNPQSFTVPQQGSASVAFDVNQLASMSGVVFNDLNQDGIQELDQGEVGLQGWTVSLDNGAATTLTLSDGSYVFYNVATGATHTVAGTATATHTVGVELQPNWFQTGPLPIPPGTFTAIFGTNPYQLVKNQDFGVLEFATITGSVSGFFLDGDELTPDPVGLAGWTVNLLDGNNTVVASTTSAGDGSYSLNNVRPGSYTVQEVVPEGWRETSPFQSNFQYAIARINETNIAAVTAADFNNDGYTDVASIASGSPGVTIDFQVPDGVDLPSTNNDVSFSNPVALTAVDMTGTNTPDLAVVSSTGQIDLLLNQGNTNGFSTFKDLANYARLKPGVAAGSIAVGDFNGDGADDLAVSYTETNSTGGLFLAGIMTFITSPGLTTPPAVQDYPGLGICAASPSTLQIAVADVNSDGRLDLVSSASTVQVSDTLGVLFGDGLGDFTVTYLNNNQLPLTAADGGAAVALLANGGPLAVTVTTNTAPLIQFVTLDPQDNFTSVTTLTGSVPVPAQKAVFQDVNGDLLPDLIVLYTYVGADVFLNSGSAPYFQDPTALLPTAGLAFSPTDVIAADINTFSVGTPGLSGLVFADQINRQLTLLINQSTINDFGFPLNAGPDETLSGNDFVNAQLGSISGTVFQDANRNGQREVAEPGKPAAVVFLDLNRNGSLDPGEPTTVTAANGAYAFGPVSDGTYQVRTLVEQGSRHTGPAPGFHLAQVVHGVAAAANDFGQASDLLDPIADQAIGQGQGLTIATTLTAEASGVGWKFRLDPGAPAGLQIDPDAGVLSWNVPSTLAPGSFEVTVNIEDPFAPADHDSQSFTITVQPSPSWNWVDALYENVLGRAGDADGQVFWVEQAAALTPAQIVHAFWESPEHRGIQVDQLYATYLHRPADAAGRANWVQAFLAGATETDVAQAFLASPEYALGHATNLEYITGLYLDVLGRAPDAEGLAFWSAATLPQVDRATVALAFLTSQESDQRQIDQAYEAYLGRAPDAQGARAWLETLLNHGVSPGGMDQALLASDEFFAHAQV